MMTYESATEAQFLKTLWRPGAELENTLFAVLDPYGQPLTQGARGPDWMFRDAPQMAASLNEIASQYQERVSRQSLPIVKTIRLGLNVAACDKRPLALVVSENEQERVALASKLAPLSWSRDYIGKIVYSAGARRDLWEIRGASLSSGYLFVSPNEFGTEGTVVAQLAANASPSDLQRAMQTAISSYHPMQMEHRDHIRWGREQGVHWESEIPVSDPHERQAQHMPF